jgi:hypothetical protein
MQATLTIMACQEDLREGQIVAVWVGDFDNESDLNEDLGQPFETDFGFVLDDDDLPDFATSFSEPRLHAHYNRPFPEADIRELLAAFSWSDEWIDEAGRLCRQRGFDAAKTVLVFPHLRYREELCRNSQARLHFIGHVLWIGGRVQWESRLNARVHVSPFPVLVRKEFGDGDLFSWKARVHLKSWKGFATREALAGEFMSFRFSARPDGDYNLDVTPLDPVRSTLPTHAQARAFEHLLDNEEVIRDAVLRGIFAVYPDWRENYYDSSISSDGGRTYQSG